MLVTNKGEHSIIYSKETNIDREVTKGSSTVKGARSLNRQLADNINSLIFRCLCSRIRGFIDENKV